MILDWSFRSLYDRTIDRTCPVARSSHVQVSLPDNEYRIAPEPTLVQNSRADFDVAKGELRWIIMITGLTVGISDETI